VLSIRKIQKKEWIWNKINCLSVSLIHKTSLSDMEAMQFVCSWCQIPGIALLYRLNTEIYMCPIKSYIFIWCPIFFWPVSYKNVPMQWDDCCRFQIPASGDQSEVAWVHVWYSCAGLAGLFSRHRPSPASAVHRWKHNASGQGLHRTCLSRRQMIDEVGQLLGRGLVSKDNRQMKCTTSKLLTCRVTNGGPIWSAFYVVSQSTNKAT